MANSIWGTPNGLSVNGATVTFPLGTQLTESALGTLAMVSSSAANQFQIPNASNLEYGMIGWTAGVFESGNVANGGTARNYRTKSAAALVVAINNGTDAWQVNTSSHLLAITDNGPDIGQTATGRPRNVFSATRATNPAYTVGATVGASGTGTVVSQLTVVNGVVTSCTIA